MLNDLHLVYLVSYLQFTRYYLQNILYYTEKWCVYSGKHVLYWKRISQYCWNVKSFSNLFGKTSNQIGRTSNCTSLDNTKHLMYTSQTKGHVNSFNMQSSFLTINVSCISYHQQPIRSLCSVYIYDVSIHNANELTFAKTGNCPNVCHISHCVLPVSYV